MWLFLRNLFRLADASERRAKIQTQLKTQSLAAQELSRGARGQNYALERMLRETEEEQQQKQGGGNSGERADRRALWPARRIACRRRRFSA